MSVFDHGQTDNSNSHSVLRRELSELSLFVLNRKTRNIRIEIYEFLVLEAIHELETELILNEIIDKIIDTYKFKDNEAIKIEVKKAINRLIKRGAITVYDKKYSLTTETIDYLEKIHNDYDLLRMNFISKILKIIKDKIEISDEDKLISSIFSALSKIFSMMGNKAIKIFSGEPVEIYRENLRSAFLKEFNEYSNNEKNDIINSLLTVINCDDKNIIKFLSSLNQSYILAEVMNMDPFCRNYQISSLRQKIVYLDTNVIIPLLLHRHRAHKPVLKTIEILNQLGIKMKVTRKTIEEYNKQLAKSEVLIASKEQASTEVLVGVADLMPDPFIKTYWFELENNENLEWLDFIAPLRRPRAILRDKYNIIFDRRYHEDISNFEQFSEILQIITEVDSSKSEIVAKHDAFHISLVHKLREITPGDEFGPKYWFLTRDHSLSMVEFVYDRIGFPSSIYITIFIEIVSPLLRPETALTDFGEVLSVMITDTMFPTYAEILSPLDVINLTRDWSDDPDRSIRTIRNLIGDTWTKECLEQIRILPRISEGYIRSINQLERKISDELKEPSIKLTVSNKLLIYIIVLLIIACIDLIIFGFVEKFAHWPLLITIQIAIVLGAPNLLDWLLKEMQRRSSK